MNASPSPAIERTHLSPAEAAKMIGVDTATIYRWRKLGLPINRRNGRSFISVRDLHAYIEGEAA